MMRLDRAASLIVAILAISGFIAMGVVYASPPSRLEIDLFTSRFQDVAQARDWSAVEAMLDPQTCPYNPVYLESLQSTLTSQPQTRLQLLNINAILMRNVDCPCVQGQAELSYVDPNSGAVLSSAPFYFYAIKHSGRLWLDCGRG
jgi:hypothetical protein